MTNVESLKWFLGLESDVLIISNSEPGAISWSRFLDSPASVGFNRAAIVASVETENCTLERLLHFIEVVVTLLEESGALVLRFECCLEDLDATRGVLNLVERFFGFSLPIHIEGECSRLVSHFGSANTLLLKDGKCSFPDLSPLEKRSYFELLNGRVDLAMETIKGGDGRRGESYSSVRYWNKLILDFREDLALSIASKGEAKSVVGLWDLRFVPHALGEYIYLMGVLQCVAHEIGLGPEQISVWCLAPGDEQIRFDQMDLDAPIRLARVEQFQELTDFLPGGRSSFRIFDDSGSFDREVAAVMKESVVVPRFESTHGGVFASYLHNYRFLSQVYSSSGRMPYLYPRKDRVKLARERMDLYRMNTGRSCLIVTHLRYSKLDSVRNVEIEEWVELFRYVGVSRPDVLFVVLGEGELEELLIEEGVSENCVFAGRENLGVMSDFALIHSADGFLGGPSGPAIVPLLSEVPYLFYKYKLVNEIAYLTPPCSFPWATEFQRVHWLEFDESTLYDVFIDWLELLKLQKSSGVDC